MNKDTIGNRIKIAMNEQNLRQIDVVNKAQPYCKKYGTKLERNDLSQYISGKTEPGQRKILVLADTLNVDPVWLMGFNVDSSSSNIVLSTNDYVVLPTKIFPFSENEKIRLYDLLKLLFQYDQLSENLKKLIGDNGNISQENKDEIALVVSCYINSLTELKNESINMIDTNTNKIDAGKDYKNLLETKKQLENMISENIVPQNLKGNFDTLYANTVEQVDELESRLRIKSREIKVELNVPIEYYINRHEK